MTFPPAVRLFPRALATMVPAALLLAAVAPVLAQMNAYGVAATVNGVGISNETLERSYQEYLKEQNLNISGMRNPDRVKGMRREVLDLLIDQELAWQAAQKEKVLASPAEVDEAMGAMRSRFKSDQAFATRLAIEGYSEERYRDHIRRLVSARKYLDRVAAKASPVGDEEIHGFYTANPDTFTVAEGGKQRIVSEEAARGRIRSYLQGAKGREAVQAELSRLRSAAKIKILLPL